MFLKLQARLEKHTRRGVLEEHSSGVTARGVTGEQCKGETLQGVPEELSNGVAGKALPDIQHDTAEAQNLVNEISKPHRGLISIGAIVEFALKAMPDDGETCAACQRLRQKKSPARHKRQNLGLHQQKRNLRHYLGLDNKPRTLKDILATQDDPSVDSLANPRAVWRNRDITNAPAQRRILSDTKCRPEDDLIIDEDHGYMTVKPGESVIFLSSRMCKR
ncbi:hypothetical protein B0H13DRAFT_1885855 [Mycena leptocephala]|nr:hypothetical protein B0H13DRAFT_1885855 [Mycena leptocephala]